MKMSKWNIKKLSGYEPKTTFWEDFCVADNYGLSAVKDTYKRAFADWKSDYIYLTELVMVLNHKAWEHAGTNDELSSLYTNLFFEANEYAWDNLKEKELEYFYKTTD